MSTRTEAKPVAAIADCEMPLFTEAVAVATEEPRAEESGNGAEPATDDYVPMSEWLDEI